MFNINKANTYLNEFSTHSKLTYNKIGKYKIIFWLIIVLIALAIQYIPMMGLGLFIGVLIGVLMLVKGDMNWINNLDIMSTSPISTWMMLIFSTGFVILCYFIYIKFIEKRPFYTIGLNQKNKFKKYITGAIVAIAMQLSYFFIILIFRWGKVISQPINATSAMGTSAIGFVLLFLVGFMVQGASEEIVVRGWMMPVLSARYKIPTAIAITSVFFGLLHIGNANIDFLSVVNLILYGVFAALYAIWDDGLWGIFAQHSIWNWFMGNVLGLPVSGMIIGNASIIETKLTGPIYITGGNFGPEGGIIVTIIEIIGIIVVARLLMRKHQSS